MLPVFSKQQGRLRKDGFSRAQHRGPSYRDFRQFEEDASNATRRLVSVWRQGRGKPQLQHVHGRGGSVLGHREPGLAGRVGREVQAQAFRCRRLRICGIAGYMFLRFAIFEKSQREGVRAGIRDRTAGQEVNKTSAEEISQVSVDDIGNTTKRLTTRREVESQVMDLISKRP